MEPGNETIMGSFATGIQKVGSFAGGLPKASEEKKKTIVRLKRNHN